MLDRLRGVAGVAQLRDAPRYPGSIVVEDVGGTALAGLVKPLAADDLIGLGARRNRPGGPAGRWISGLTCTRWGRRCMSLPPVSHHSVPRIRCASLRPVVTSGDGWFVAGKFDQYRRDLEFDAGYQAFRALGRLLLAEPDDELTEVRERMLRAVGPNAGLVTAVVPEFASPRSTASGA